MVQEELGLKHQCTRCDALFYDLNKNPITCPCGYPHDVEAARKLQRAQAMIDEENQSDDDEGDLLSAVDVDDEGMVTTSDDDTIIEDTSDLDGGNDDIGVDITTNEDDND